MWQLKPSCIATLLPATVFWWCFIGKNIWDSIQVYSTRDVYLVFNVFATYKFPKLQSAPEHTTIEHTHHVPQCTPPHLSSLNFYSKWLSFHFVPQIKDHLPNRNDAIWLPLLQPSLQCPRLHLPKPWMLGRNHRSTMGPTRNLEKESTPALHCAMLKGRQFSDLSNSFLFLFFQNIIRDDYG